MAAGNQSPDEAGSEPATAPPNDGVDASTPDDETIDASAIDEELAALLDEATAGDEAVGEISEEAIVALIAERDDYLDQLQRAKAEFANARRRSDERMAQQRGQAAAGLVEKLLPVLDSCEIALGQGIEEIRPIHDALFDVLSSRGLARLEAVDEPFDPELHEAVMYEEGDGEQIVVETLRTGYRWNDRVLRAAMVKVQG